MSPPNDWRVEAGKRLGQYHRFFLDATRAMFDKAVQHECVDPILAYLCLWVSFNNLYSLNSFLDEWGREEYRIKRVLGRLSEEVVSDLLSIPDYLEDCRYLIRREPRGAPRQKGILNMQDYFRGKPLSECVRNVGTCVPDHDAPVEFKRAFLNDMVTGLLYTARNNLFHAIKGPQDDNDVEVARRAYCLLKPIVKTLLVEFERQQVGGN